MRLNLITLKLGRPKSLAETVMQFVPFEPGLFDNEGFKNDPRECLYTNLPAC